MQEPWYKDGLRFECTRCGNCCTGPKGFVWFTEEEGRAMAASLGLSEGAFQERHARRVGDRWALQERPPSEHGYDCVFLDRSNPDGTVGCRVYSSRPSQCRTWPFWPYPLASRRAWERVKRATPCPGMDQGPLHQVPEPPAMPPE